MSDPYIDRFIAKLAQLDPESKELKSKSLEFIYACVACGMNFEFIDRLLRDIENPSNHPRLAVFVKNLRNAEDPGGMRNIAHYIEADIEMFNILGHTSCDLLGEFAQADHVSWMAAEIIYELS